MAKGYWIAQVDVTDPERYRDYIAANAAAFEKYGGRFLVRGGAAEAVEGAARSRIVVIEFPSFEAAKACYASPEYATAKAIRDAASTGDLVIVEGWSGAEGWSEAASGSDGASAENVAVSGGEE